MAYIDNELFLLKDEAVGATVTSAAFDLGNKGGFAHPLYFDVKLTKAMTTGSMTAVTVQSASDAAFTTPVDEVTITVPASITQTAGPATLAQFFAPIKLSNRYVRLKLTGASTPAGGKISAYMTSGMTVGL